MSIRDKVLKGFGHLGAQTLKAWGRNRERADWIDTFYSDDMTAALARFDESVATAARLDEPECWIEGWGAIAQLRKNLRRLKDEFECVRNERQKETFVAEIREQLALV